MRNCMEEKHSNVPHIFSSPETKAAAASRGTKRVCIPMRLQATSPTHTAGRMERVVRRNFRRNRTGNAMVTPTDMAHAAIVRSSAMSEVPPAIQAAAAP